MGPEHSKPPADASETRVLGFLGLAIVTLGAVFCLPPIPQDQNYHAFADGRTMLGVPNFLNVVSILPFLVVGVLGLKLLLFTDAGHPAGSVWEEAERRPLLVFFAGVSLTAFGSAYYHLAPDNDRLVWDRLPMTIAFMGFFASMIGDRIGLRAGMWLLWPLVWLGFASVLNWRMGESHDAGDLRLYGFVQFYPLLAIPLRCTCSHRDIRAWATLSSPWLGISLPRSWSPDRWTTLSMAWATWSAGIL